MEEVGGGWGRSFGGGWRRFRFTAENHKPRMVELKCSEVEPGRRPTIKISKHNDDTTIVWFCHHQEGVGFLFTVEETFVRFGVSRLSRRFTLGERQMLLLPNLWSCMVDLLALLKS